MPWPSRCVPVHVHQSGFHSCTIWPVRMDRWRDIREWSVSFGTLPSSLVVPCRSHTKASQLNDNCMTMLDQIFFTVWRKLRTGHFEPCWGFNVIDTTEIFARIIGMQFVDSQLLSRMIHFQVEWRPSIDAYLAPLDSKWYFKPWKISTLFFNLNPRVKSSSSSLMLHFSH